MYAADYTCHVDVGVNDVCGLFVSLLSMCEVMGIHMYIPLVGLY